MNRDALLGLIRHILTAAGGGLAANGVATSDQVSQLAGALVTIVGVVWSILEKRSRAPSPISHLQSPNPPSAQPESHPPRDDSTGIRRSLPTILSGLLCCCIGIGCASFRTEQTDESKPDGTRTITTVTKARTFLDSKSSLAQLKASQTDKTQSLGVGSLAQESSGQSVTNIIQAITQAAIQAAITAAAP